MTAVLEAAKLGIPGLCDKGSALGDRGDFLCTELMEIGNVPKASSSARLSQEMMPTTTLEPLRADVAGSGEVRSGSADNGSKLTPQWGCTLQAKIEVCKAEEALWIASEDLRL